MGHFHWHHHPEIEIHEVLSGKGERLVLDGRESFRSGDLCLLGEDLPHCIHVPSGSRETVRTRALQFHPGIFGNLFEANADLRPLNDLLLTSRSGLLILGELRLHTHRRLIEMKRLRPGDPLRFAILLQLLSALSGGLGNPRLLKPLSDVPTRPVRDPVFSQLAVFLDAHFSEPQTQKSIAALLEMKPSAFSRWFKRRTGATFETYLTALRLRNAALRLMEKEEPVGNVATLSGFASATHFHRVFRERHRETPTEFRERIRRAQGRSRPDE